MRVFLKKNILLALSIFLIYSSAYAGDKPAYVVYNAKGRKISYSKMEKKIQQKRYVFFGELHDNSIAHWLQYELLVSLHKKHGASNIVFAMEMFERDNQDLIEAYIEGKIDTKKFEDSCRFWSNYRSDYKPMLEYARSENIKVVGSNIPRRFASLLFKKGEKALDSLSLLEKSWIAPLPLVVDTSLSQYSNLLKGFTHNGENFVKAQAIKDATMAYFSFKSMRENQVLYHINGSYHSDFQQGILWYLERLGAKKNEMITISTVTQENIKKLDKEYVNKADFIICTPESIIRSIR